MRGWTTKMLVVSALAAWLWPATANGGEVQTMNAKQNNTAAAFVAREVAAGRRPNKLIGEKSPYLLQHAFNPVDWQPWGEEAFARARRDNLPIFLSIGYSTCHWCHVMERESFEDPAVAAVMNRYFVCIKVDREERPDLDQIYMTVTQAMTGGGGWPMSVFLTPDLKPFFAGTYFPPQGAFGRPGFTDLLERIHAAWQRDHGTIGKEATAMIAHLDDALHGSTEAAETVGEGTASAAAVQLTQGYDPVNGGFGVAPKFPRPVALAYLLRYAQRTGDKKILAMTTTTLKKMAAGGMYDQLGGGFHRYSVDAAWRVPHFEKMLYDQAQLATLYLEAAQLGQEVALFKEVAAHTLDYVLATMVDGTGGFTSAEDADSPLPDDPKQQGEGAFYLWRLAEIQAILERNEAEMVSYRFGITAGGNAPSDPHGDFKGRNILYQAKGIGETARQFGTDEAQAGEVLARACRKLLAARGKRPRPHLDDKVLASWNGLMISALAKGALVLGEERYLQAAERAALFLRDRMIEPSSSRLWHRFRDGEAGIAGLLEDYAFTVQGLLDLYEASFDWQWLEMALRLTETQIKLFADDREGGFFATSGQDAALILRMKGDHDGAEPAGNSVAALNLLRLGRILSREDLVTRAAKTIQAFAGQLKQSPAALPQMLAAYEFKRQKPVQVVIAGERGATDTRAMQQAVAERFLPNKVMLLADGQQLPTALADSLSMLTYMSRQDGKATTYLCENFACQQPTTDLATLRAMLAK